MTTTPNTTPDDVQAADLANGEPAATEPATPDAPPAGQDTATGTDPDVTYDEPGYQDKSLGQAVDQDRDLVDDLIEETDGDLDEAARRFDKESAGRHVLDRQGEK